VTIQPSGSGVSDGSVALQGYIGELVTGIQAVAVGAGFTIAQWGNVIWVVLTPGDWDVSAVLSNVLAAGATRAAMALSLFSGNVTTDHVVGSNQIDVPLGTAAFSGHGCIAVWNVNVSAQVTVYLKGLLATAVGNAFTGRISARRIR
jgi:hypothetical protein